MAAMDDRVISLEDYALIRAGLELGLSLRRALENAKVPAKDWGPAAIHWEDALDERNADPELRMQFELALLRASERFEPLAEPIASNPMAWGVFRRHVIGSTDPAAFLAKHGIDLAMFGRLEGLWSERASDPAVAEALQEANNDRLGPCPRLEIVMSPLADPGPAPQPKPKAEAAKDDKGAAKPDRLGIPNMKVQDGRADASRAAAEELPTFMRPEQRMVPLAEPAEAPPLDLPEAYAHRPTPVPAPPGLVTPQVATAPLSAAAPRPFAPFQPSAQPPNGRTTPLEPTPPTANARTHTAIAPALPLAPTIPFSAAPTPNALSKTAPMEPEPPTSRVPTVNSGTIAVDPRMVEEALRGPLPFDDKGR